MTAFYNDNEPFVVAWLEQLISRGYLPKGQVDPRPIQELKPSDCAPTSHFFAGIGGWPYALHLAGWPPEEPVWTGSCPCQPFSTAGKRKGTKDERHLWPEWLRLIQECRPPTIFGEQVASPLGREWLARVRADLEALGYEVGATDLCAASVGAPHIRQRLWWVADSSSERQSREYPLLHVRGPQQDRFEVTRGRQTSWLGDPNQPRPQGWRLRLEAKPSKRAPWASSTTIPCADKVTRRTEPSTFPLAHGVTNRVGLLRGYGNAIVPQVAAAFIQASTLAIGDRLAGLNQLGGPRGP